MLWSLGKTSAFNVFVWSTLSYICVGSVSLAVYVYTPELYPTRMRAFGPSAAIAWLRLASIIGPFIVGAILAWYNLS
jgi:putative MFS transporter